MYTTRQIYEYIYRTPLPQAGCDIRSIFNQSKAGLNSEVSFIFTSSLNQAKELSLLFTLRWEENRWIHAFPRALAWNWKYKTLSRIWTWVVDDISYDDNSYTMNSFLKWMNWPNLSIMMQSFTLSQFLSTVHWVQIFSFPRLVAMPCLKNDLALHHAHGRRVGYMYNDLRE